MRQGVVAGSLTKPQFRAAVDAAAQWVEDNRAAYNTALPQPARSALSSPAKALLLCYIVMRENGLLPVAEDG
jgi:hypothetical protein